MRNTQIYVEKPRVLDRPGMGQTRPDPDHNNSTRPKESWFKKYVLIRPTGLGWGAEVGRSRSADTMLVQHLSLWDYFSLDQTCSDAEQFLSRAIACNKHNYLPEFPKEPTGNGQIC